MLFQASKDPAKIEDRRVHWINVIGKAIALYAEEGLQEDTRKRDPSNHALLRKEGMDRKGS